jgi:hypothetical protein
MYATHFKGSPIMHAAVTAPPASPVCLKKLAAAGHYDWNPQQQQQQQQQPVAFFALPASVAQQQQQQTTTTMHYALIAITSTPTTPLLRAMPPPFGAPPRPRATPPSSPPHHGSAPPPAYRAGAGHYSNNSSVAARSMPSTPNRGPRNQTHPQPNNGTLHAAAMAGHGCSAEDVAHGVISVLTHDNSTDDVPLMESPVTQHLLLGGSQPAWPGMLDEGSPVAGGTPDLTLPSTPVLTAHRQPTPPSLTPRTPTPPWTHNPYSVSVPKPAVPQRTVEQLGAIAEAEAAFRASHRSLEDKLLDRAVEVVADLTAAGAGGSINAHDVIMEMRQLHAELSGTGTAVQLPLYVALLESRFTVFHYNRPAALVECEDKKRQKNRKWTAARTGSVTRAFTPADGAAAAALSVFASPRVSAAGADKEEVARGDMLAFGAPLAMARKAIARAFEECRDVVATAMTEAGSQAELPAAASVHSTRMNAAVVKQLGDGALGRLFRLCGCTFKDLVIAAGFAAYTMSSTHLAALQAAGAALEPHISADELRVTLPAADATVFEAAAAAVAADAAILPVYRAIEARVGRRAVALWEQQNTPPRVIDKLDVDIAHHIFSRNRITDIARALK